MYIYPFLAVFWSALGIAILLWHGLDPHAQFFENFGSAVVAGWVAIVLGIYNVVRWWGGRSDRRFREERARRGDRDNGRRMAEPRPPNPAFDFGREEDENPR